MEKKVEWWTRVPDEAEWYRGIDVESMTRQTLVNRSFRRKYGVYPFRHQDYRLAPPQPRSQTSVDSFEIV